MEAGITNAIASPRSCAVGDLAGKHQKSILAKDLLIDPEIENSLAIIIARGWGGSQ